MLLNWICLFYFYLLYRYWQLSIESTQPMLSLVFWAIIPTTKSQTENTLGVSGFWKHWKFSNVRNYPQIYCDFQWQINCWKCISMYLKMSFTAILQLNSLATYLAKEYWYNSCLKLIMTSVNFMFTFVRMVKKASIFLHNL